MITISIAVEAFLQISNAAIHWFNGIKGRKEQQAAKVLMSTGLIVAGIRMLDNSIQKLFGYIKLGVTELKQEQREILVRQINDFAREEVLLPKIRVYYEELDSLHKLEIDNSQEIIDQIKESANNMLNVLVAGSSPFMSKEELDDFLSKLRKKDGQNEDAELIQICNDILSLYNQNIIVEAEKALGNLRGIVLRRYPKIPYPDWM